jgi:hypothetical protein
MDCVICLEPVGGDGGDVVDGGDGAAVQIATMCEHGPGMHQRCLRRWVRRNASCPVCRAPAVKRARRVKVRRVEPWGWGAWAARSARWAATDALAVGSLAVARVIGWWATRWFVAHQHTRQWHLRLQASAAAQRLSLDAARPADDPAEDNDPADDDNPAGADGHRRRFSNIANLNLRELRAVAHANNLNMRRYQRRGERLSRSADFRAVLERAMAAW